MKEIKLLLQWNAARVAFVSLFLIALMRVKTVNSREIATGFSGKAEVESHYERLQRFFLDFEVNYQSIVQMVVKVMQIHEPWVFTLIAPIGNSARPCLIC